MAKITLFLLTLGFLQIAQAGAFKIELVSRDVKEDDEDKNAYMLSINNKTDLGLREMEAFKRCVIDITLVNPTVYGQTKAQTTKITNDLLKLTETNSVKQLNDVLKDLTCKLYQAHSSADADEKAKNIVLTTPTKEGLDELIDGALKDCLDVLDDSKAIVIKSRKDGLPIPAETIRKEEEARYCPKGY